jgi:hypothetical protein
MRLFLQFAKQTGTRETMSSIHVKDNQRAQCSPNRVMDATTQRTLAHGAHSLRELQLMVLQGLFTDVYDADGHTPMSGLFGAHRARPLSVGALVCGLGSNANFQLGNANDAVADKPRKAVGVHNVVQLVTSTHHTLVVTRHGHLFVCGSDTVDVQLLGRMGGRDELRAQPVFSSSVFSGRSVRRVALSEHHVVFVTTDNRAFSFGNGPRGQLGLGDTVSSVSRPTDIAISGLAVDCACSATHSVVATDRDVFVFGHNAHKQLGLNDDVVWAPKAINQLSGQAAYFVGANSRSTVIVFGPTRGVGGGKTTAATMTFSSPEHDENGPRAASKSGGGGGATAAQRPTAKASDGQRIFIIGCDRLLPERLRLAVPFDDAASPSPARNQSSDSGGWRTQTSKPTSAAMQDREHNTVSALAMNEDLIVLTACDGKLYCAPAGPSLLARRWPLPLRVVDVALRVQGTTIVIRNDHGMLYELQWSYVPCSAWAGRLVRLPFVGGVASVAVAPLHVVAACGAPQDCSAPTVLIPRFGDLPGAECDLTLQAEDGKPVSVHRSVLSRSCAYFGAMSSFEATDAVVRVDSTELAMSATLSWIYDGHFVCTDGTALQASVTGGGGGGGGGDDDDSSSSSGGGSSGGESASPPSPPQKRRAVTLNADLVSEMLQLADMWLLSDLAALCVELIGDQLTTSNVFDFAELGEALTIDMAAPHPLLRRVAAFVCQHHSEIVLSPDFLEADPSCVDVLDRVIFGDRRDTSSWKKLSDAELIKLHDVALARAQFARQTKATSFAAEHANCIKLEMSRRSLPFNLDDVAEPVAPKPKPISPPVDSAQVQPPPVDEDSLLDNAVEEFLDREREASPPPLPPLDIRAEFAKAHARADAAKSAARMGRWRKKEKEAVTGAAVSPTQATPWRAVPASQSPSKSLLAIQVEQLASPDDTFAVQKAPLFSQILTGASPGRSPGKSHGSSATSDSKKTMREIMEAEASAALAAQLQAEFDKEAAEEALRVAEMAEMEERALAESKREAARHRSRGRGRGARR